MAAGLPLTQRGVCYPWQDVARLFLKAEQPITYVVDKRGQTTPYVTFEDGKYMDVPLILLVDSKTASASEILSSCLQVS